MPIRRSAFAKHLPLTALVATLCSAHNALAQTAAGGFRAGSSADPDPAPAPVAPTNETTAPQLRDFVQADYPAEALAAGIQGSVLLSINIDNAGQVTDVSVLETGGNGFDDPAMAAARRFRFTPAQRNGQPIAARIRYRYRFTLTTQTTGPVAVLHGVVKDNANHPVARARMTLHMEALDASNPGVDLTTNTDEEGQFRFEVPRAGSVRVDVISDGFRPYHADERVYPRDDINLVYRLMRESGATTQTPTPSTPPDGEDGPEIVVRGTRPPREVSRTTLERQEITKIPGTGGDALRSLQNLPGMARPPFLSGALIVRGSAPQDTRVYADGTEIPLLYHFGGLTSVIQTDMLDRIDFYPGNFSSRFGRAMGGAVDVGLRSPRDKGWKGIAQISLIDASLFIEGAPHKTLSFAIAARRSYLDAVLGPIVNSIPGINFLALPVYWDYQGVLEWRPNPRHRIRLALYGNDDSLALLFKTPPDTAPSFAGGTSVATRSHTLQLLYSHIFAPGTEGRAMFSVTFNNVDLSAGDTFKFGLASVPFTARYELTHTFSDAAKFNFGLDMRFGPRTISFSGLRFTSDMDLGNAQRFASDITEVIFQPALYAEAELVPTRGLRIVPGVRVDYFHEIKQATISPRVSARWEFYKDWFLKGGVGLFTQPPQFQESSAAPNTLFPGQTLGNPNLLPQRAMHYSLGVEHNFSRWISLSVEGFYKSLDQLIVATPQLDLRGNNPRPPYLNTGIGRIYGMELLLRHKPSERFFGWIAYTLMRSERQDTPTGEWRPFAQDQTHILTLIGSVNLGKGWEAGARFRVVSGTPYTLNQPGFYSADSMTYTALPGPTNGERNPAFHQLDLRVDKTFQFKWGKIAVFLEVLNVYYAQNQEGRQYNYNYTQNVPINGLPIFPNLGLRGEL